MAQNQAKLDRDKLAELNKIGKSIESNRYYTRDNRVWARAKDGTWLNAKRSPVPKEGWTPEYQRLRKAEDESFEYRIAAQDNPYLRRYYNGVRFFKPFLHGVSVGLDHASDGQMAANTMGFSTETRSSKEEW